MKSKGKLTLIFIYLYYNDENQHKITITLTITTTNTNTFAIANFVCNIAIDIGVGTSIAWRGHGLKSHTCAVNVAKQYHFVDNYFQT